MENVSQLNEAFRSFTQASRSLEVYYEKLNRKVRYLTQELERKNAQLNKAVLEVGESKDCLQAILQSIGEAIIVLDQHERITMVNRAAEELLCITEEGATGQMFGDLDFRIVAGGAGEELHVKGKTHNVILSRSRVSDRAGALRGYVILIKDITRLKELEGQHKRNERLIAMGEMAAKIVHEIRSPLCSIELFSNMLSKDLEGTRHSEMASGISAGIKSLNNILTNMLFFAKPQKPSFVEIALCEAVNESFDILAPLIGIRGINVRKTTTGQSVRGDKELLKQVFMNIIVNAVQSMPGGGELEITMEEDDDLVSVIITDEGEGIPSEIIEKIFDPFFSTKERGTGLGLAIAHKIMQGHDGFIKAYRNEGRGSTFCVSFPKRTVHGNETCNENLLEKVGT